ncbi:asparagine synthase-related protein [Erythrobacter sp. THAF29]|uniref:asparagine synthase-related protein n=1 Tax=Erythrobacter sp. THAF29 TaxID=2587851 RepID=UPI001268BFD9|nr:asparagine synthase-related protein [Erythrobacter sp. THAF29]QFT78476.1 Asparagine synthetase [glutamine-hydrolyzing] 3 [Erythrobacter sp. THAF29]
MSGFAVEFRRDGREASIESANRMKDALRVLGADKQATIADGPFAITWTFSSGFSLSDPSERQPVKRADRWHLLFLGKLNHRAELAEKLRIESDGLDGIPDCELAMGAWLKWGEDCRDHLYGGYSLLVCDTREHRLTAIRSPERSQQLYLFEERDRLIVASSTKAIFAFPEIPREVDELKIADALVLNHQDTSRSYFKNVSVIGQSCTMVASRDQEPRTRYFDMFENVEPVRFETDDDYAERAREIVDSTLATAFRVPGKPALSLSAGLDSTTLAVLMIERMRAEGTSGTKSLKAYTGVPESTWDGRVRENWLGDESGPVRALARMYPELDVDFVSGKSLAFDQEVDMLQSYADMPTRGVGNSAWGAAVRINCRRDGHKLLVNGAAGNGTVSLGIAHILFAQWLRTGRFGKLARETSRYVARRPQARLYSVLGQAAVNNLPDPLYDGYMRLRGHVSKQGYRAYSAINPGFAEDTRVEERLRDFDSDDRYRMPRSRQDLMRAIMQKGARNDGGGLFEAYKAMAGIDSFVGYEDRKLIEFCFAIPDDQFYRDGVDRRLIKQMMKGKLPPEVLNAPRGEQASDWHSRRKRDLDRILAELERLEGIPEIAGRLDIERMKTVTREWPDDTPISSSDYPDYGIARYGIGRAIAIARFINQVEGRN